MADLVLSASSLNTYTRCPKQWEFAYAFGVRAAPSLRAVRGIAVHAAVETNMRQKMTTEQDLPITSVLDAYSDAFEKETKDGFSAHDETKGEVKDAGVQLASIYHTKVAPKIQPFLVEEPIQFAINGQPWSGQLDLAELKPRNLWGDPVYGVVIRDTKTSGRAPKPDNYALNMTGYDLGVRQKFGEKAIDIKFDYLISPKGNKRPYYEEISTGEVSDERIAGFSWLVGDVAANIRRGAFPATGLTNPGVCDWCGYKSMCPAYKAKNPNA